MSEEYYIIKTNTGMMGFADYEYHCSRCNKLLYDLDSRPTHHDKFCRHCGTELNGIQKKYNVSYY